MNRFIIVAVTLTLAQIKLPAATADYVILLHGLGRTPVSMKRVEWTLQKQNYRVINVAYPSTRMSIQDAADRLLGEVLKSRTTDPAVKIHFVAHSLGGIILRQYLSNHKIENLGRVVMLAPPNHGSELVDRLRSNRFYRFATGPAGQQLGTSGVPNQLGPANFELGIIAGDRSLNPLFSSWISGADEGQVSVDRTNMPGAELLVVHHSHTWMAWSKRVNSATVQFLRTGSFGE